jgi:hypothetical protein
MPMGAGKETKQTHDGWLSAGIGCFCEQVSRCHSIYRYQQNASAHFRTLSNIVGRYLLSGSAAACALVLGALRNLDQDCVRHHLLGGSLSS